MAGKKTRRAAAFWIISPGIAAVQGIAIDKPKLIWATNKETNMKRLLTKNMIHLLEKEMRIWVSVHEGVLTD